MFRNNVLERIKRGEKALGISMNDPSEELVEIAGRMGLDFVNFDGQHAPLTPERVGTLCRIADGFGITPTMRIPDGEESTILSYLDRGIRQITVPNLLTRGRPKTGSSGPSSSRSASGARQATKWSPTRTPRTG